VAASGNAQRIDVSQLEYYAGKSHVWLTGSYVFSRPKPLDADLFLWRPPMNIRERQGPAIVTQGLEGEAHASGTLLPMNIALHGQLVGNQVTIGQRQLGDVRLSIEGKVDPDAATLRSTQLKLLEGDWQFSGQYLFDQAWGAIDIHVADVSLHQADAFFQPPPKAQGLLREAAVHIEWPHTSMDELTATGNWVIENFSKGSLLAEQISGKLAMKGEDLTINDIVLRQKDGVAKASLTYNLGDTDHLGLELATQDWPLELPRSEGSLKISGNTRLDIDLKRQAATGPVDLSASAVLYERPFGTISIDSDLQGKQLRLNSVRADAFGGELTGHGVLDLGDWPNSTGDFLWQGVQASDIAQMWPTLQGLGGTYAGELHLRHNDSIHIGEPLLTEIRISPADGHSMA